MNLRTPRTSLNASAMASALALSALAATLAPTVARADESTQPAPPPGVSGSVSGSVSAGPPGSTTVVSPPGSGGLTVVTPTPGGGSVTATGCTSVMVNGAPTMVAPGGGPCPQAQYAPYQPYSPYYGPPPGYYDTRPKYARDPDRSGAVIGSAIVFGVGAGVAGLIYLVKYSVDDYRNCYNTPPSTSGGTSSGCNKPDGHPNARASLFTYGAIVTFAPSVPRFVVGDNTKGIIYTALRGASFAAAALIDWRGSNTSSSSDSKWEGPFLLGFVAPITLGIIDLATTPHREDLEPKPAATGITGVAPVAVGDKAHGATGAMLAMQGVF